MPFPFVSFPFFSALCVDLRIRLAARCGNGTHRKIDLQGETQFEQVRKKEHTDEQKHKQTNSPARDTEKDKVNRDDPIRPAAPRFTSSSAANGKLRTLD